MRIEDCWYKEVCKRATCQDCLRYSEMSFLVEQSGLGQQFRYPIPIKAFYESYSDLKNNIEYYVDKGFQAFIYSKGKSCKTAMAVNILLRFFDRTWLCNNYQVTGMFVPFPEWCSKIKEFDCLDKVYFERLKNCSLLVLDDILFKQLSNFEQEQLFILLAYRIKEGKSTIYTGRYGKDVKYKLGERVSNLILTSDLIRIQV